jgi:methylated-DNA-[protein]-cysteine S-methyltransferase
MQSQMSLVFPSKLGWIGMIVAGATVRRLSFGHPTAAAAMAEVTDDMPSCVPTTVSDASLDSRIAELVERIQAYAAGAPDDFRDVSVDLGSVSEFRRRVLNKCRQIPYGATITYTQLATRAGCPGAARAVGNCMAGNRVPLLIPCHRVVASGGGLGGYSAPGGVSTKRRLLALESGKANN